MPKIFISHSWEDNKISKKLAEYLKRDGVEIWIDYARIEAGDKLPKRIGEALKWCDTLVLVWSKKAAKSYWVEEEWTNALSLRKRIIPCILGNAEIPTILSNRLYIDLRKFDAGYLDLCRALSLKIFQQKVAPLPSKKQSVIYPDIRKKIKLKKPVYRSQHVHLTSNEVKTMLKKHNFFDKYRNKKDCIGIWFWWSQQISHHFPQFSPADILEKAYHRKNSEVNSHKVETERQKQPNF